MANSNVDEMKLSGKRVLISQGVLFTIAGSEVASYELAGYFASRGAEVIVATFGFSAEWEHKFLSLGSVDVYRYDSPELSSALSRRAVDIAWIHHQVIPEALVREPGDTRFIFHHMSSFLPQEFPVHYRIEQSLASAVVFTSPEALQAQRATGLLDGIDQARLGVLGNPAPDAFYSEPREAPTETPRILVVSNHVPDELSRALATLGEHYEVVIRGSGAGAHSELIEPELLAESDAVITIGKTVQYAIVGAVPVYCYDHFGGPGWLDTGNFDAARALNFSGRGFGSKTAKEIADELRDGLADARSAARELHERHARELLLGSTMDALLDGLGDAPPRRLADGDVTAFLLQMEIMNGLSNALEARGQTVHYLTDRLALDAHRINELEERVRALESIPGLNLARAVRARVNGLLARAANS